MLVARQKWSYIVFVQGSDQIYLSGVPSKNKSSCMNILLSYEPFSVFQDIEGGNRIFSLIANGLYLNIEISVKLVFE